VNLEDVKKAHEAKYVDDFLQNRLNTDQLRRIGLGIAAFQNDAVYRQAVIDRVMNCMGSACEAARRVCSLRLNNIVSSAGIIGGGAHHAHYDFGSGFCVWNDISIAAVISLQEFKPKILSLDLDVHQGDGTATMLKGRPDVFTVSLHARSNFPFRKSRSDIDVEFEDETKDSVYLKRLQETLKDIDKRFGTPDLVFYQAGVDPLEGDRLGRLSLSHQGLLDRDNMVYEYCLQRNASLISTMGGGYFHDDDSFEKIIRAHVNQIEAMANAFGN